MYERRISLVPCKTSWMRESRSILVEVLMYHGLSSFASRQHTQAVSDAAQARRRDAFVAELVHALCAIVDDSPR